MTAQQMVDLVAKQLTGLKIGDTSVPANESTLLGFLNLAKNQIAIDTLIWLGGEIIPITTVNEYTLSVVPIQIIDVYDKSLIIRPKNSPDDKGYYMLSPSKIYVNTPVDGDELRMNYYYTPADYIITDTIDIPPSLILATQNFMKSLAYDIYKSEKEQILSEKYMGKYEDEKNKFVSKTDNGTVDSIVPVNKILEKGLV